MQLVLLGILSGDSMFWIGFGVGALFGAGVLIVVLALCKVSGDIE